MWFMQNAMAKPDNAGAGATDYMHMFGLVALGYMWCRIAEAALAKLPKANGAAPRMKAKLVTARFFMERMLPETAAHLARIQSPARARSWNCRTRRSSESSYTRACGCDGGGQPQGRRARFRNVIRSRCRRRRRPAQTNSNAARSAVDVLAVA